jgi:hypothetical protein
VWKRERVGRTSVEAGGKAVEVIGEDPAALGEAVVDEDPVMLGEAVVDEDTAMLSEEAVAEAWRWKQRSERARRGPNGGQRGAGG